MNNIMNYISWRGDLSFNKDPFNEVDNVIFSTLSYLNYDEFVPQYKSNDLLSLHRVMKQLFGDKDPGLIKNGLLISNSVDYLANEMSKHHRFRHVKISNFINIINDGMQFSATTFILNHNLIFISFKGTDDSLSGWEEDFKMTYQFPIPAQKLGIEYTIEVMNQFPRHKFILGGHSKGGNVAVYVAANLPEEYQERIEHVYNNDGPGFVDEAVDPEKIKKIDNKCTLIIPYESIVGALFHNYISDVKIVYSSKHGINQHDTFSWEVERNHFVYCDCLTKKSKVAKLEIDNLIYELTLEEREKLGNDIGSFMKSTNAKTLTELSKEPLSAIKAIHGFRAKNRKVLDKFISIFIRNKLI